jgi:hypothetical protein
LTLGTVLVGFRREFEQQLIYQQFCRLVLLYQAGGLVIAAALSALVAPVPPQVATCGFFVETFG